MTDANSIMDKDSVKELMAAFTSADIAYVSGRLLLLIKNLVMLVMLKQVIGIVI